MTSASWRTRACLARRKSSSAQVNGWRKHERTYGNVFEIQASAAIRRNGEFGSLVDVAVDRAGTPGMTGVDTLTTSHAFQMVSKADPGRIMGLNDVSLTKLDNLVAQRAGRTPVLVHSNPLDSYLAAACAERRIGTLLIPLVR